MGGGAADDLQRSQLSVDGATNHGGSVRGGWAAGGCGSIKHLRSLLVAWALVGALVEPSKVLCGILVPCVHGSGQNWFHCRTKLAKLFCTWDKTILPASNTSPPGFVPNRACVHLTYLGDAQQATTFTPFS